MMTKLSYGEAEIKKPDEKYFLQAKVSAGGLEPPTLCLKGRCSTPELRAHFFKASNIKIIDFYSKCGTV